MYFWLHVLACEDQETRNFQIIIIIIIIIYCFDILLETYNLMYISMGNNYYNSYKINYFTHKMS
jgi:hypothetical protein